MSLENEGGAPSPEPELSAEDSLREAFAAASESDTAKPVEAEPAARADGRDDKGRFAAKAAEPHPEPSQTIPPAQPEAQAAPTVQAEPTQPPASWSASAKAVFNTLPPIVQQEIAKREADVNRGFEARAAELKRYEPLEQVLAPRRDRWSAQGVDEATAVKQLLAASDWLDRDPRSAVQWLMRQYGVHPQHLGAQMPGQQPGAQPQAQQSPEFRALLTEVQSLKTQLQQRDQAEQDTRRNAVTSEIQAFAADPANVYFHNVKDRMSTLLASGQAKDLKDAYDQAVWANPETRQLIQQDQSKKAEAERLAAQRASASEAKRASGSVTGSPPAGARSLNGAGPSNDPSDDLRNAFREAAGRA